MLLIATVDPSLKIPLKVAEKLLFPNKFTSEKYCVAVSTSSKLNLKLWNTSCTHPLKFLLSANGSQPLGYSILINGEPFFLKIPVGWSVLK
uniref:LRR receptor-like serine/threonine-protein kinase GSO2 n=1 Tax=Rhizophora mucronata TaxID=61149 RepID=A0A2P2NHC4_RHIMU